MLRTAFADSDRKFEKNQNPGFAVINRNHPLKDGGARRIKMKKKIERFTMTAMMMSIVIMCGFAAGNRALAQGAINCTPPTTGVSRVYYTSCFPRQGGETTDHQRVQRAVNTIPTGKLIFNEGYYVFSDTVVLRPFLILEGTSTSTLAEAGYPSGSHIKMTASNKAIFKIGENIYDVVIRDMGLSASSANGTIGILGEGALPNASLNFEFNNIRFSGFQYGIKVEALDSGHGFQFDNVKVEHCSFEGNSTGIYIDSYNSGWQIHSIEFYMGANQVGIDIVRNSYSDIDSLIGNGTAPGTTPAAVLTRIKEHGNLRISNSVSEGVEFDLKIEGLWTIYPIHLDNNTFQDKVEVSGATVVATSNQYGLQYPAVGLGPSPQPVAKNSSRIYSYGEKFCFDGLSGCATGGWVFQTGAYMVASNNDYGNYWSQPSTFENVIRVNTNDPYNGLDNPLVSIIAPTYGGKALLRLGQTTAYYTLSRNPNNGWLDFKGNQGTPYVGYNFNGPVKLPSYAQSGLPTVLENGSLVFCSDCAANTSPCAGGGGGTLAISISSQWVCK